MVDQGDRSCAKARRAFAEKFGLGTNNTWYVLHNTQLNVQICKYVQKQSICRENSEHVLDESFYGHFCPRRNAANFCHPGRPNAPAVQCLRSLVLSYHMYDF